MFDFTLPVVIAGGFGLLFLWLVAPRLLPERQALMSDTSPRLFNAALYVNEDSYAAGKTLTEVLAKTENRMRVTASSAPRACSWPSCRRSSCSRATGSTCATLPSA